MMHGPDEGGLVDNSEGGLSFEQIHEMLLESQHWPPEVMQAYQRSQLEQLLRHAKKNVPFYAHRLDCMFKRDGSIDWSRWGDIPILKREDLRDHRDEMLARELPAGHGEIMSASSSGSTGVPITVSYPGLAMTVARAAWLRMHKAHGFDNLKRQASFKLLTPDGQPFGPKPMSIPGRTPGWEKLYIPRSASSQEKLEALKQFKTEYLADTTNSLEILARVNLTLAEPLRFKGADGVGMGFTEEQRQLMMESFGAKCISPYSSKEGALIAAECPVSHWFHITSETLLFECLDENEVPVPIGEKGRATITPFFYTAQPLIRYDQGDIVKLGPPCPCGCTLPTLLSIEGRSDPIFRFPDRDVAIAGLDFDALRKDLDAIASQIAQVGPHDIEVRYVASADATNLGKSNYIKRMELCFGTGISFKFKRIESIPYNSGGKQQRIVREYQP